MIHKPVLLKEVIEYLNPGQNENFVDCTIGEGGHAEEILNRNGPDGKVLGIDLDPLQISSAQWLQAQFQNRIILANDSYANLREIVERKNFQPINGILLDLGMSSAQLEGTGKGFSFKVDQGLDMRYNDQMGYLTSEKILNEWPEDKIEKILKDYGEEKFSKKIARNIVEKRKSGRITSTFQLIEILKESTPPSYWHGKIHYATRTFQALRIAVNDELENLRRVLPEALSVLSPGGRLVAISFHSLEDRIVKKFLAEEFKKGALKLLNKKPITASRAEVRKNPRARSAKLRAIIKL
ncbi:MAG: 16S rRNA (cytosine(1402)-N(4))-methyltransferase RsmH [bacterium]